MDFSGLGPRKSVFIVVIVVGCFSILWPKIFHPMLMGMSEQEILPNSMDKTSGIRQERPPHLRGDLPHPAMRERGRAIPAAMRHTLPPPAAPVEQPFPQKQHKLHEGRVGPIPGMRPPLGGAGHMTPAKTSSSPMGVLMPLYTIAIVIFFIYTLMKIIFKKPQEVSGPYSQLEPDPVFRRRVFGSDSILNSTQREKKDSRSWNEDPKLVVTAIQGLVADIDRTRASTSDATRNTDAEEHIHLNGNIGNGSIHKAKKSDSIEKSKEFGDVQLKEKFPELDEDKEDKPTVKILGMETTARCEGGQKWSRPSSPIPLPARVPQEAEETLVPQSIFLEGTLPHQSQLLVAESETHTETLPEQNDAPDDPPVILSGKMTLSVINLDNTENVESQLDAEDDNAVLENGMEMNDDENDEVTPEIDLDMTDENLNELEDEDIDTNIETIEVVMDEDINMN
uniref:Putative patellin-5 isoform x5 n=1 Tax=Xenopsylla cheopis TaxID=163159 RepID=A0A6M2DZI6_XENCH